MEKKIKLITVTNAPEHATRLIKSAEMLGWDLVVLKVEWKGFGTKLIATYEYLKQHPEVERFVFCDAFDVVCFGTEEEFIMKFKAHGFDSSKIVTSAERGLWPSTLEFFRNEYPQFEHGFNFINSGLYYANSDKFIEIFDGCVPKYSTDDQEWLNTQWVSGLDIEIDHDCILFQSYSFVRDDEYEYNGRPFNKLTNSKAIWYHGNGKTDMSKVIELL